MFRYKLVEFKHDGITLNLPKSILMENSALRVVYDKNSAALCKLARKAESHGLKVVNGVMYLDLMELPEMAKQSGGWKIRPSQFLNCNK